MSDRALARLFVVALVLCGMAFVEASSVVWSLVYGVLLVFGLLIVWRVTRVYSSAPRKRDDA